jgi:hypothetical protein
MALMDLFAKKKKEFKASCKITREPLEKGFGYLLTTAQIVTSKKYWDLVMTEPETLSYTISHFQNQQSGTQMRSMIFEKYASVAQPWMISDSIINYFDVDKTQARANAKKWWETEGTYSPDNNGPASEVLDAQSFTTAKDYAIQEAGRARANGSSRHT